MIGTPLTGLLQFYNINMRIYYKYCAIIFNERLALPKRAHPAAMHIGKGEVIQEGLITSANDISNVRLRSCRN
jgi:hypothetical protein